MSASLFYYGGRWITWTELVRLKSMCVGCFQTDGHAVGCPTGQNGTPNYS